MQSAPCVETLLASAEKFLIALRSGSGYNEDNFQELITALKVCADEWKRSEGIPKNAVNLLVDLSPGIEASSYLYLGDDAARIMKAADIIHALVLDAVS